MDETPIPTPPVAPEKEPRTFRSRLLRILPAVLVVLAATVPCWPVLVGGQTFYYRDISLYHLPQRALAGAIAHLGHLPTWDPYFHGGSPLWANPDNLVAHPTTLLFALLPAALAFGLDTALFLALAAWGTWLLARRLGLSPSASVVATAAFATSGVLLAMINFHPAFLALAPLPAVLVAWDAWIRGGSRRWLAALCILAGLIGLSGGAEAALSGAALVVLWTLLAPGERALPRRLAVLATCGVVALLLAAPAWMPALELVRHSDRATGYSWAVASLWSLHPARLPELCVPGFLGDVGRLDEARYWGRGLEAGLTPYFTSVTVGPIVAVLAVVGACSRSSLPRGLRRGLAGMTVLAFVLATVGYWPGLATSAFVQSFHSPLRFPIKFVFLAVLPIALLAGAGADVATTGTSRGTRRATVATLLGMACCLGLLAAAPVVMPDAAARAAIWWFRSDVTRSLGSLARALGFASLQALVGGALVALALRPRRAALARGLLAAAVALFLLDNGILVNPTAPRAWLESKPGLAASVQSHLASGKLYRADVDEPGRLSAPTDDVVWLARYDLESLRWYTATRYGIPVAFHLDPDGLGPARSVAAGAALLPLPWPRRLPLLTSGGVTCVVTTELLQVDGLRPLDVVPTGGSLPLRLYALEGAAATLRFVPRAMIVTTDEDALDVLTDPAHDPRTEVVLHGRVGGVEGSDCTGTVMPSAVAPEPGQDLVIDAACDGFLVLAIPFQPGIEVEVDGTQRPVLTADFAWCAVQVAAGHHVARWRHVTRSLPWALALAGIGVAIVLVIAAAPSRARPA